MGSELFTAIAPGSHVQAASAESFADEVAFLRRYSDVIVLHDQANEAQIAVVPAWQGRVMTSAAHGAGGNSFGWVNHDLIRSAEIQPHINVLGGEDRLWMGPEGGQFSIFFAPGAPFDLEHFFTPAALDTEPFEIVSKTVESVQLRRRFQLTNYSGTEFDLEVRRTVSILDAATVLAELGAALPAGVNAVAFESENRARNIGNKPWRKETGLLSIWILGMFNASRASTVVMPYQKGTVEERGAIVNDEYFGKVPADRLVVQDNQLFFRADGQHRGKIGLGPERAKPVFGSYDGAAKTLTLVQISLPEGEGDYVNSMWGPQDDPYSGDVVNSYNDDGSLGNFYELESSSPALALGPGDMGTHRHRTMHLQGDEKDLDASAIATLGVGLDAIRNAFQS